MLSNFNPPEVIINQDFYIQHFRGQTGLYNEPLGGNASLNLLQMTRQDRVMELRTTVHEAIKEYCPIRKENARIAHDGSNCKITRQVFIAAMEVAKKPVGARGKNQNAKNPLIQELEQELLSTREYMQSIIGEQDTTNEKLQSANKEIQSVNVELPSINEELETAKEELQSTNEVLSTINEEHETRNQELNLANIDPMGNIRPNITEKEIV